MERIILTFISLLLLCTVVVSCSEIPSGEIENTQPPAGAELLDNTQAPPTSGEATAPAPETSAETTAPPQTDEVTTADEPLPVDPDLLYTYITVSGNQYSFYPGRIAVYFLENENSHIDIEDVPASKIKAYYAEGEPIDIEIGGGVIEMVYTYHGDYYDIGSTSWEVKSFSYKGQSIEPEIFDLSYPASFRAFEADGIFAVSRVYQNMSETYLLTENCAIKATPDYYDSVNHVYNGETIVFYKGEDGRARYKNEAAEPMSNFQVPEYRFNITSREQYFGEDGVFEVVEGGVKYMPEKVYSWTDYFERNGITFDYWYETYRKSDFLDTMDRLFENSRALIYEKVLMDNIKVIQDGEEKVFSACEAENKSVAEWKNTRVVLIDLDGDGRTEMLAKPKSSTFAFVVRYEDEANKFRVYYIPAESGRTFYANGEFGTKNSRTRIVEFKEDGIVTEAVDYAGNTPDTKEPAWVSIYGLGGK